MTHRLLLLVGSVLLGACASPAPTTALPVAFDASAWLSRARPAAVESVMDVDFDDPKIQQTRALADELDAAVGWAQACDTSWDPERGAMVVDDGSHGFTHGLFSVHDVAGGTVVSVTCDFGAYQGSYALVRIADGRATLLAGQGVDLGGTPFGPPTAIYSTPRFDGGATFSTFGLARGLGDCGVLSAYEITEPDTATLLQARARDCDADPELAGPPETWPVVFSR